MKSLRLHTPHPLVLAITFFVMLWTIIPQGVCLRELFTRDCGCCAETTSMACCCTQPEPAKKTAHTDESCELCFTPDRANTALPRMDSPDPAPHWVALPFVHAVADLPSARIVAHWQAARWAGPAPPPTLVLRI